MSLALPYPSLVFVPLDVLTADEMNQIVANYEFISNQFPIDSDNIDPETLGELAYLPNDTITLYGIYMFSTTAAGKVAIRFTLPKSLAYVESVSVSNGVVGGTYGFMVDSSRQMSSVNPRLAANQTITGSIDQNMGVLAVFDPDVGSSNLPAYCSGIMTVNGVTLTFS